eukprot:506181-Alexandrium_andersonii.AAC.1
MLTKLAALSCHRRRARASRMVRISLLAASGPEGALRGGILVAVCPCRRALADSFRHGGLVAEAALRVTGARLLGARLLRGLSRLGLL